MPAKPHKLGFKMWGRSGISGFLHDFKIYESKIPNTKVSECGVSGDIVLNLTKILPKHKNYKIFADNFFTGIPLVQTLLEDGFFMLAQCASYEWRTVSSRVKKNWKRKVEDQMILRWCLMPISL